MEIPISRSSITNPHCTSWLCRARERNVRWDWAVIPILTLTSKRWLSEYWLVELARLYVVWGSKTIDLSASEIPFLVIHVAYPISASQLSSRFTRIGSCTHIPFLVIYIDYLISVSFLPRVSHFVDFNYSGNTKIWKNSGYTKILATKILEKFWPNRDL